MNATPDPPSPGDIDPRPEPPVRPDADMCCGGGCIPCIFDYFEEAQAKYEVALKAWEARQQR